MNTQSLPRYIADILSLFLFCLNNKIVYLYQNTWPSTQIQDCKENSIKKIKNKVKMPNRERNTQSQAYR